MGPYSNFFIAATAVAAVAGLAQGAYAHYNKQPTTHSGVVVAGVLSGFAVAATVGEVLADYVFGASTVSSIH